MEFIQGDKRGIMIVIILNGPGESGKGTFVELISEIFNFSYEKYSSIAWAKKIAELHFGWKGDKTPENRELIGKIKQLGIEYGNIPFKKVVSRYRRAFANHYDLFITDVREPDEINKLKLHFKHIRIKCITIRIQNTQKEQYAAENLGIADNQYANFDYDFEIPNNGTIEDFRKTIMSMLDGQLTIKRS